MAIRCIALDLDHTTLNKEGKLSEGNRKALLHAMEQGVQIVVASGRALSSLPEEILALPGLQYAVTSNGAVIYELPEKKCLRSCKLEAHSVEEILRLLEGEDVVYEALINGRVYSDAVYVQDPAAYGASPQAVMYVQSTRIPVEDMVRLLLERRNELIGLDVVVPDAAMKARLWKLLEASVSDIYITTSIPRLIEISHCTSGKHNGMRFVRELLGISAEETAAFGDEDNDRMMLQEAGIGVAVANASEDCKAAADWITGANWEDGVAQGIYRLLELK